ncbi:hypothetical protein [Rhizobium sp. BG4]|uniref:hypothetical protein n=1 Tax=Rhizobium sp. BG4 TaxID=2613770 RepID=UPI00193E1A05|nr:hypothetical protein [Rhizobium sp. BG4]QRM45848.1 hypothetical protein F2982_20710 [Rhizobium sp. BG4]
MVDGLRTPEDDAEENLGLSQAYRLLVQEVGQLREAQKDIRKKLEKAEAARDLVRQLLSTKSSIDVQPSPSGTTVSLKKKKPKRHRSGSQTAEVISRVKEILQAEGRPLDRGALLEAIQKDEFRITAANPARFIGRTLWESVEFIHIPGEGYWLKGVDLLSQKS